jgi:type IV pilus assembly protein PilF
LGTVAGLALALGALGALGGCGSPPAASRGPAAEARPSTEPADLDRRARVRLELAGLYFGRGQSAVALDELKLALAIKPDLPEAFSLRGLIQASMGEMAQADESFLRALQLAPRDGNTLHNYGWFLCQQRRYPEADLQFSSAIAQPQYQDPVRTLLAQGVCQARAGRWPEAERSLSRSYELDPSNAATAYNLSDVLLRKGDYERARFYVGRVNGVPEASTAQSLWLAARIERKLGNTQALKDIGRQLRERFPTSNEAAQFERGQFDE